MQRRREVLNKLPSVATEAYGLLKTSLKYQTKEFFDNSTLHGVRYIKEQGRPFGEKFIWFCLVSIGAIAAFVIIGSLWEKFQTNPTLTGLDTDFHNQQVFFPTVTICPIESFSPELLNETAFETFARNESEHFEEFLPVLKAIPKLSYETFGIMYEAIQNLTGVSDDENKMKQLKNLRQLAFKVGIKCDELLEICKYKDEEIACCEYFMPLYSEQGLCYSFNAHYFSTAETEIKGGRMNDLFETDKKWGLTFVPMVSSKVYVHSIDEVTGFDVRPIFEHDIGYAITLLITMKQTYTTDDARQLTIGQRKCIFPDERRLKYYKDDVYSFSQCMKLCRLERSNFFCQCIPPFYVPAATTTNYRHCSIEDFSCLVKHVNNITDIKACKHCELSCLNTVYDIEKFSKVMVPESNKREDFHINIEFLTWPIIRYKREVLFGWVDLLVSFGGIAGLFLGFSLLSGVEVIYYFTLRATCMIYKNKEELLVIQKEKEARPKSRYDDGLLPKLKQSDRLKSLSLPYNIQAVRPVESAGSSGSKSIKVKTFDSPKMPIKNRFDDGQINIINKKIEKITTQESRLQRLDLRNFGKRKLTHQPPSVPLQQNLPRKVLFRPILLAPYAHKIKPLDKKFRTRSHSSENPEILYEGYLD
ncbi:hypothetical protein PVAND_012118 [Polypedilum vanderplanki]|uniref:Uncharacterized protein n=1 Tax=Polypedilum vanderplanki TaxID=319348 RepID=A0A9J6CMD8_POLVA|nr:hypothetical protein PVAND_012118 [Polypedilum vanderplanki]